MLAPNPSQHLESEINRLGNPLQRFSLMGSRSKMDEMGIFSPDWTFINPLRPNLLEKYNQVFGA
jgi:hypothetical protein